MAFPPHLNPSILYKDREAQFDLKALQEVAELCQQAAAASAPSSPLSSFMHEKGPLRHRLGYEEGTGNYDDPLERLHLAASDADPEVISINPLKAVRPASFEMSPVLDLANRMVGYMGQQLGVRGSAAHVYRGHI